MKKRMKRLTAILLSVIMLTISLPTLSAGAEITQDPWMYKIDSQVLERMDNLSEEETIRVWIWFTYYDENERERRIEEETGLTEELVNERQRKISDEYNALIKPLSDQMKDSSLSNEERTALSAQIAELRTKRNGEIRAVHTKYWKCRKRIMHEMGVGHSTEVLNEIGVPEENIIFVSSVCVAIVNLPKSLVFPAAHLQDVVDISYDEQGEDLPEPTETDNIRGWLDYYIHENHASSIGSFVSTPDIHQYEELYTHRDSSGEVDWVLIDASIGGAEPWMGFDIIGNRVRTMGPREVFPFGMAVYDAQEHTFCDLSEMDDYSAYPGLDKAIDTYGKGRLLGDLDQDDAITVLDATILMRCAAQIAHYPDTDLIMPDEYIDSSFKPLTYYSDFNRDGKRNVTDATCIQRYLVGASYPKYR